MSQQPGYSGEILTVNLSDSTINKIPTSVYSDRFIGGRGIAAKIYWDEVTKDTDAFDSENRILFMTGPVCGVPGFAGSRWQVSSKSPLSNQFTSCNLGGSWGVQLKFAGFDGIVIHGKSEKPVYLIIDDGKAEIKDAGYLKGKGAIETRELLKEELDQSYRVVAIGPAGENRVVFATLLADSDSSGSGGMGSVMGSKNLKAIAVRGNKKINIANNEKASDLRSVIKNIKGQNRPTPSLLPGDTKREICFGCINGCIRSKFTNKEGKSGKSMCHSGIYYFVRAMRHYGTMTDVPFSATKFCDEYGMDSYQVDNAMKWLLRGQKAGLFSDEQTGMPLSRVGSLEFIEALTRMIALRQGIGDLLADGIRSAAKTLGHKYEDLITDYVAKTGEMQVYDPRLYLTTGILWAMETRLPIAQLHEISRPLIMWAAKVSGEDFMGLPIADNYVTTDVVREIAQLFWGSEIAADFSTYEGKALAALKIQNRQALQESLILCDMSWPIFHSPNTKDHLGDPDLARKIYSTITGNDIDEAAWDIFAERIFNICRANHLKDGRKGRREDALEEFHFTTGLKTDFANEKCIVPGKEGEVLSRKGMTVDRNLFEKMKDEYYSLRNWDVETGLPTKACLEGLDLKEVAQLY